MKATINIEFIKGLEEEKLKLIIENFYEYNKEYIEKMESRLN